MKRFVSGILIIVLVLSLAAVALAAEPVEIKVLILPKFENGDMAGDFPGEAQYYYEAYCMGGEEYEIVGGIKGNKLFVKDGVALYVAGVGKVSVAISLTSILNDTRFDFSHCYVISTGCAGSAYEYGVMGDVFLITACVDFDLGHHADARELSDPEALTWFMDAQDTSCKILDPVLMDRIYDLVKDVRIETTERTRNWMSAAFDGAAWAVRDPQVLRGTTVTGDNYWKGMWDHKNAAAMVQAYHCPDPYALTEMEDVALACVMDRYVMLDRFIVIRDSVNMDVFMNGATPESLWDPEYEMSLADEDNLETADIFRTAMLNNFLVGRVVMDAILAGEL